MSQPPGGPPPAQPPYPPPGYYGPRPLLPDDERTWAIVAHLGPTVLSLLSFGFLGFLTPLVVWLSLRNRSAYVGEQAKESLNFQLTLLIGYAIGWITILAFIGFVILPLVWIGSVVFAIIATVAVNRHESYRYPLNIRVIS